jgi:hypothetical protein
VEVKRRGEIDGVEQLTRYLELMNRDPPVAGVFAAQQIKPQARTLAEDRGIRCVTVDYDAMHGMQRDDLLLFWLLDESLELPQRLVPPSAAHVRRAFALRDHIRVADGLYVALADELGCPLVTTDRRLAGANTPCEVRVPPSGLIPPPREG